MSAIQLNRYAGAEHDLTAAGLPEGLDALIVTRALRQRLKNDEFRLETSFAPQVLVPRLDRI